MISGLSPAMTAREGLRGAVNGLLKRFVKRWRFPLFLLGIALIWWSSRDFVSRGFGTWPAVRDPAQLVLDCERLLQTIPDFPPGTMMDAGTDLASSQWPGSISVLQPRAVTLYPGAVDIFVSSGGIGPSFGYLVAPRETNPCASPRHYLTRPYKRGICFWESEE